MVKQVPGYPLFRFRSRGSGSFLRITGVCTDAGMDGRYSLITVASAFNFSPLDCSATEVVEAESIFFPVVLVGLMGVRVIHGSLLQV